MPPYMPSGPQGYPMQSGPIGPMGGMSGPMHRGMPPATGPTARKPTMSGKMGPPAAVQKSKNTEPEIQTTANGGFNNYRTAPDLLKMNFKEEPEKEEDSDEDDDAIDQKKAAVVRSGLVNLNISTITYSCKWA